MWLYRRDLRGVVGQASFDAVIEQASFDAVIEQASFDAGVDRGRSTRRSVPDGGSGPGSEPTSSVIRFESVSSSSPFESMDSLSPFESAV